MSHRPLDRIRAIGRIMQPAVTAAAVLLPVLLVVVTIVTPDSLLRSMGPDAILMPSAFLPAWTGLVALGLLAVPVGTLVWGLWQLRGVFAQHRQGEVFSPSAAQRLRRFAGALLASAVLQPIATAALTAWISVWAGMPALRIAIAWHDLFAILIAGVMLAVACVIEEGVRLAEENASFV